MNSVVNTEEKLGGYLEYKGAVVRYSMDGALAVDNKGNLCGTDHMRWLNL